MAHAITRDALHTHAHTLVSKAHAKLTAMHHTKAEQKARTTGPVPAKSHGPEYPYGLSISLEHPELQKLGVKRLPKAGGHLHVHARVKVTRSETSDSGEGPKHSLGLQITHLALKGGGKPLKAGAHPGDGAPKFAKSAKTSTKV